MASLVVNTIIITLLDCDNCVISTCNLRYLYWDTYISIVTALLGNKLSVQAAFPFKAIHNSIKTLQLSCTSNSSQSIIVVVN